MKIGLRSKYDAVFEVNFHLGELYFLIPLLYSIKYEKWQKICIVITKYEIYTNLKNDSVLLTALKNSFIDIVVFNFKSFKEINNIFFRKMKQFLNIISNISIFHYLYIIKNSSIFFVQINGGIVTKIIKNNSNSKMLVKFPHSSTPAYYNIDEARKRKYSNRAAETDIFLNYEQKSNEYYSLFGFRKFVQLGYHSTAVKWINLIKSFFPDDSPFIIIFSYKCRPDVLPQKYWEQLHLTTYQQIRNIFGNIKILIKPHPNQDIDKLKIFLQGKNFYNVELSTNNPMLVSYGARAAISFLTSGIYNALFNGVPSANYYNAKEIYEKHYGHFIHDYNSQGIPDLENEIQLRRFLIEVKSKRFKNNYITKYLEVPKTESLSELLRAVKDVQNI